ncbi:hypothetical protein LPJ59_001207 [Coemansia sp. RSA 2399]|nr:hypothetical protein LPJ59_001207 [Coemansia sp. RSA 2399]
MTDLDLDSKAILNGLVHLDQHNQLPPIATNTPNNPKQQQQGSKATKNVVDNTATTSSPTTSGPIVQHNAAIAQHNAAVAKLTATSNANMLSTMSPTAGGIHFNNAGPHAIATLKVETSAVIKELSRFRACDDQSMSCFYCREWAQWVYRKQIAQQSSGGSSASGFSGSSANAGSRKKKKTQGGNSANANNAGAAVAGSDDIAERERKRAARVRYSTIADLCESLRTMISDEKNTLLNPISADAPPSISRPVSPTLSVSSGTSSTADPQQPRSAKSKGVPKANEADDASSQEQQALASVSNSALVDGIVDRVTHWYEGYQFPLADVYEDLTFDFPPDAFPYDDNQDPLDPALLLPALQVTKTFISLPASSFPLLGNITSELIATHTYPTCQHTKADHPTPSELETQRLIFNSQLQKWRGEYKRSFEREMEPVWQITQLLLKSAQRIEAMRVRLFARGCRANREQFLQTIRNRTQPFAEYWTNVTDPYRTGKAATMAAPLGVEDRTIGADDETDQQQQQQSSGGLKKGRAKKAKAKTPAQLAAEVDSLMFMHLDNLLEVSASWSRTFLESYYGVAREFARELETILGECITMCDRRAQGLKYPPPLTLQPQLEKARVAISCLLPQLEDRIKHIQDVVRDRNSVIFNSAEEARILWTETSGSTVQTKLAKAAHKDFKKNIKRIESQQQSGVIGWAMRELEHLLTAPDVAAVVADCLELLMTEAEILERAVGQVFVRKLEPTTEDLREQRQDIIDDFTEGLLTGREELAGIVGKLMLKEAWRILEANISLQRQKALLNDGGGGGGGGSGKGKKNKLVPSTSSSSAGAAGAGASAAAAARSSNAQGAGDGSHSQGVTAPTTPAAVSQIHQSPGLHADQQSVIDDDDLFNDDTESVSAKKRKKNKKKKKSKKKNKNASAASASTTPTAPSVARASANDGASVADDDYDAEDDVNDDENENDPSMMQNPFSSLKWADKLNEHNDFEKKRVKPSENDLLAATAPREVPDDQEVMAPTDYQTLQPAELAESSQELLSTSVMSTTSVAAPTPATAAAAAAAAAKTTRSRRGTNAARYVPGVGFVSDDGTNSTSPQLGSSSNSNVFKPPATGVVGSAATRGSLGLQAGSVRGSSNSISNGRISPMNAARLATPTSRSQSPLATGMTSAALGVAPNRKPSSVTPPLDGEALAALQDSLVSGPQEAVERTLSGLPYENLVSLAVTALSEKRRLVDVAMQWQGSVTNVLQTYDNIAEQIELFKGLCDAHDSETARLSSLLAQAAQEAQSWHEQYDKLSAEVDSLRVAASGKNEDVNDKQQHSGDGAEKVSQVTSGSMANMWAPMGSQASWAGFAGQQQQQQMMFGSGGAAYGQFPRMPPHAIAAAATAGGGGNVPASAMNHPLFAAATMASMDPASLMMLTGGGSSQMAMGMMGGANASGGMAANTQNAAPSILTTSASTTPAASAASASLLTSLNAGSHPL